MTKQNTRILVMVMVMVIVIVCMGCAQKSNDNYEGNWIGFTKGVDKIDLVAYNPDNNSFKKINSFSNNALVENAAMNVNGSKYAFTIWNEQGTQETLVVENIDTGKKKTFFKNEKIPCELKGLSFIDNNRILLRKVEIPNSYPMEKILILDTENNEIINVEQGYIARTMDEDHVNESTKIKFEILSEEEDVNNILKQYGSNKSAHDIEENTILFTKLSNPSIVDDKSKLFYTKTLFRNVAIQGEGVMLGSSVWCYDLKSKKSKLIYTTEENAIIGYVTVNPSGDVLVISEFKKPSGEDGQLLKIDLSTPKAANVLENTEKVGYVFIEPIYVDNDTVTYLSVENGMPIENAKRYVLNVNTGDIEELTAIYNDEKQLFKNFSRTF